MVGYKDIKKYLQDHSHDSIGQFGINWIEKTIDEFEEREFQDEKRGQLTLDDETIRLAVHNEVDNILEVIRGDAPCAIFFSAFKGFLEGVINKATIEEWTREQAKRPPVVNLEGRAGKIKNIRPVEP
jgi:hypothetical protein